MAEGGGGAIDAEGVCRLVFLGGRTCAYVHRAPFEEGTLQLGMGGAGLPLHWVGDEEGGFRETARGRQPIGIPHARGKHYYYCVRVGQLSHYSHVLLLPLGVPHRAGGGGAGCWDKAMVLVWLPLAAPIGLSPTAHSDPLWV